MTSLIARIERDIAQAIREGNWMQAEALRIELADIRLLFVITAA